VIGILTHLTDTTQNTQFHDKYFSELDFDMSKCLFVFSYNDEQLVNPILKDRMVTIDMKGYDDSDKIVIARDYLIPEIAKEYLLSEIKWTDEQISFLIHRTEKESGVRNLKRSLEKVYSEFNLLRTMNQTEMSITYELLETWFPSVEQATYSTMYL
jgi:ATP-dependent Lon protease